MIDFVMPYVVPRGIYNILFGGLWSVFSDGNEGGIDVLD